MQKDIKKIKIELLEFKESLPHGGIKSVSEATGIGHSTVSRILNGEFSIINPNVTNICKYAEISIKANVNTGSFQNITEQLLELWDGSLEMEIALLEVIKGLRHLQKMA